MHRLTTEVGWPVLVLAAVILVVAAPIVVRYLRFELELASRVLCGDPADVELEERWEW